MKGFALFKVAQMKFEINSAIVRGHLTKIPENSIDIIYEHCQHSVT